MNDSNSVTPSLLTADDIYVANEAGERTFEPTPVGKYRMAVAGTLRVKKTKNGERKLEVFFKHTEAANKAKYKGVTFSAMMEGTASNGKPKAKALAELLCGLGISKDDALNIANRTNGSGISELESFDSIGEESWKGVAASIVLNGDSIDLAGREANVVVEENTFNGKTTTRAKAAYAI